MSTLVSIGIPFRDAQRSLGDAIRSVFAQTHQNWELFLVDDGSIDGSLTLAQSILDSRVTVVSDRSRRGLAHRLNEIARMARGDYLARMDADDLMHPQRIARQLDFLETNPDIDVVGTACIALDDVDEPYGYRGGSLPHPYTRSSVLRGAQLVHPTVMARTAWFRSHPYDCRYERAEDMRLWCEAVSSTRFGVLPDALYYYREGASFAFDKYLASHRTADRLIREFGADEIGNLQTIALRVRNTAEVGVAALLVAIGRESWLTRRRNTPLSEALAVEARGTLDLIRRVPVPGLT